MPVRSARIAAANSGVGSELIVYTTPAGRTAIVKHVCLSVPAGTNTRAVVFVKSGPIQVSLFDVGNLGVGTLQLQGFIVLEPGDQLGLFASGAAFVILVSGAILDGVEPS